MARIRLQDSVIGRAAKDAALSGKRVELTDSEQRELCIRLSPNGPASWTLACKDSVGRFRRFMLGNYPAMGLRDARIKAAKLRESVREGADPISDRKAKVKAQAPGANNGGASEGCVSIRSLLATYEMTPKVQRLKSWPEAHKRLVSLLCSVVDRPVADLTLTDLQNCRY